MTVTKAQREILYAPYRAACCRDYAGYEPHPVVFTLDEVVRCDGSPVGQEEGTR